MFFKHKYKTCIVNYIKKKSFLLSQTQMLLFVVLNFLSTISDNGFGLNSFLIAPDYCICMSIVTESLLNCGFLLLLLFTVDCSSHSH